MYGSGFKGCVVFVACACVWACILCRCVRCLNECLVRREVSGKTASLKARGEKTHPGVRSPGTGCGSHRRLRLGKGPAALLADFRETAKNGPGVLPLCHTQGLEKLLSAFAGSPRRRDRRDLQALAKL